MSGLDDNDEGCVEALSGSCASRTLVEKGCGLDS